MRASTDDVFLPDFSKRIIFQPFFKLGSVRSVERRGFVIVAAFNDHDVLWLKTVEKCTGLGTDEDLCVVTDSSKQPGNYVECVGM